MKRICCPRVALGNNCLDESAFGRSAEGNRPSIKTSCAKASACSLQNSQEVGEQSSFPLGLQFPFTCFRITRGAKNRAPRCISGNKKVPGIGSKAQYIHASDHCSNMKNAGACDCAKTGRALVRRVLSGRPSYYLVL